MARDDLEQQRLHLEPPHEVGERLRRLLGLGDHRVRQRDLPIRLDEQHADVELHRHELGDAVSVLDDVEPLLDAVAAAVRMILTPGDDSHHYW